MWGKPGLTHNQMATRANMRMGKLVVEMHKSILPSAAGCTGLPTTRHPKRQQPAYQCLPIAHMSTQGPAPPPGYYTGMPPGRGRVLPAHKHGLPRPGTRPSNQLRRAVSARSHYRTNNATAHPRSKPYDDPYFAPNQQPYQPQYQADQQQQGYYF